MAALPRAVASERRGGRGGFSRPRQDVFLLKLGFTSRGYMYLSDNGELWAMGIQDCQDYRLFTSLQLRRQTWYGRLI